MNLVVTVAAVVVVAFLALLVLRFLASLALAVFWPLVLICVGVGIGIWWAGRRSRASSR